jgi:hypothetical protein
VKYILENKKPVVEEDLAKWSRWFEDPDNCRVAETKIGYIRISTVFLGIDHNFDSSGEPVLFETMIFGGKFHLEQARYCSWEEAEQGHEVSVKKVKRWLHLA